MGTAEAEQQGIAMKAAMNEQSLLWDTLQGWEPAEAAGEMQEGTQPRFHLNKDHR